MSSGAPERSLPILPTTPPQGSSGAATIALVGNPNAGKTSLFNRLTGMRAKTANFPGTTVEHRRATITLGEVETTLVDLPGLYSLDPSTPDERVACDALEGLIPGMPEPDLVLLVVDSTNLERNLFLASQVLELGDPTVVALNLSDAAEKQGITFNLEELRQRLGCPVVPVSARTGAGVDELLNVVSQTLRERKAPQLHADLASCGSCKGCQFSARYDWASRVRSADRLRRSD